MVPLSVGVCLLLYMLGSGLFSIMLLAVMQWDVSANQNEPRDFIYIWVYKTFFAFFYSFRSFSKYL